MGDISFAVIIILIHESQSWRALQLIDQRGSAKTIIITMLNYNNDLNMYFILFSEYKSELTVDTPKTENKINSKVNNTRSTLDA